MGATTLSALTSTIAATLGLWMLSAGVGKTTRWPDFRDIVAAYELLPSGAVLPGAIGIICAELVTGVGLLLDCEWALASAAALLSLFAVAVSVKLLQGVTHIECGCVPGQRGRGLSWSVVVRNTILAGLALLCIALGQRAGLSVWLIGLAAALPLFLIQLAFAALWGTVRTRHRPLEGPG